MKSYIQMLGVKRIEWLLPVGTSLTVAGEATKDDIGIIRIQQLPEGPFYVARKTINEHISKSTNCARWCKYASVGLTVFGALQ
ncbi:E3 ubiquitin-protein ligase SP1-like [Cicer arietinum]|uniref:E3 ubiquitin-protein ligase SP1-like n=1 Tax=Cicer arietinum TaxID=3827 RepID=UPI003CC5300F